LDYRGIFPFGKHPDQLKGKPETLFGIPVEFASFHPPIDGAHVPETRAADRFASTLVIAASIIAAVRLARDQDISRPSPRLTSVVTESVGLARLILEKVVR
jgi:hypothetical protein